MGRYPYAAIQVDLPMWSALPRRDAIPIVYNAHNCTSALLSRRAKTEPPHVSAALLIDAMRVRRQERALIDRSGAGRRLCRKRHQRHRTIRAARPCEIGGRPVMTTAAGAFGLDCLSGRELMVRDEPAAFAETLASLVASPAVRSSLVARAFERVEDYDWRTIGRGLRSAYERLTVEPSSERRVPSVSGEAVVLSGRT